ncbi:DUF4961 domain-containing protein [Mucilaginibacter limnophilus]|uniref:DUF4961 domain-containing protein n=1 Tax=Mucilaginibacter limnophilus TaxID=1932778 RepID=A0A3S2UZK1_9SPHI|nr:DUF4961 domain-containing protein [Mucilaginibacter limnophilus]RVT97199.1 DUF4961 domain-containing protein [Mucilaginibacter limnophilus]
MNKRITLTVFLLFVIAAIFTRCIFIDELTMPANVQAGKKFKISMRIRMQPKQDRENIRFVFAMLVPKGWHAKNNTKISYTSTRGNGILVPVPANVVAAKMQYINWPDGLMNRVGMGKNTIPDFEWVVFWTQRIYSITSGEPEFSGMLHVIATAGNENAKMDMGFMVCNSFDGFEGESVTKKVFKPLTVSGGKGLQIDYQKPQTSVVTPLRSRDTALFTISLDGNRVNTPLSRASIVYLYAKGYANQKVFEVSEQRIDNKMVPLGNNKWQLKLRPRTFFDVEEGQSLKRMEYYFVIGNSRLKVDNNSVKRYQHTFQ